MWEMCVCVGGGDEQLSSSMTRIGAAHPLLQMTGRGSAEAGACLRSGSLGTLFCTAWLQQQAEASRLLWRGAAW